MLDTEYRTRRLTVSSHLLRHITNFARCWNVAVLRNFCTEFWPSARSGLVVAYCNRPYNALLVLSLCLAIFLSLIPGSKASTCAGYDGQMECLINGQRSIHGQRVLRDSMSLDALAAEKIQQDISCQTFSHYPCEVTLKSKAEVLAYGSGIKGNSGPILKSWLASRPHAEIILGARWHFFGIATWRGRFLGNTVRLWAVEFA